MPDPSPNSQPQPPAPRPHVLVVEDDPQISSLIRALLEQSELAVTPVARAGDAIDQCKRSAFDLVVLDLGLPDAVGYEALEDLRRATSSPILVLSGRAEQLDRVHGLELGADDYLAKPFFGPELVARVRTLLRRAAPVPAALDPVRCGPFEVDPVARQVTVSGTPVELTRIEFDLLLLLVTTPAARSPRTSCYGGCGGRRPAGSRRPP